MLLVSEAPALSFASRPTILAPGSSIGQYNNALVYRSWTNGGNNSHIDWHLEAGLAVVFAEAPQDSRTGPDAQIIKQTWSNLCPIYLALPEEDQ
jgi:hypothetical protein